MTLPCPPSARRFVTPVDAAGDGELVNWTTRANTGADSFGRVTYRRYFRPAGVPVATASFTDASSGVVYTAGSPTVPDLTNNRTHGYESFRDPNVPGTNVPQLHYGAAPSDLDQNGKQTVSLVNGVSVPLDVPGGTQTIPTFNQFVNTYFSINPATGLYDPTANLNEANEMNLYAPGGGFPLDQSFGHGDLEWLYRGQDVDADALKSRLADLAPISFTNPADGLRRAGSSPRRRGRRTATSGPTTTRGMSITLPGNSRTTVTSLGRRPPPTPPPPPMAPLCSRPMRV